MIYLLLWMLAGSLAVNIFWILRDMKSDKPDRLSEYISGIFLGLLLGPLSFPFYYLMNRSEHE